MRLKDIYSKNLAISFEVFPQEDASALFEALITLKKYNPVLVSLTYGAGGSNQELSKNIILKLKDDYNLMPHFTCICSDKKSVGESIKLMQDNGIENILALRGDVPDGIDSCYFDFSHANQLVDFIKEKTDLSVAVAGYPEGHIESPDAETDIKYLKQKVECGADAIYTQLFFNNDKYYKFVERVRATGINVPVVPGIMPILSQKQVEKMTGLARIEVPSKVQDALRKYTKDDLKKFGVEYASEQCNNLISFGVKGLHFFTLNRSYSTSKILDNIL